MPHPQEGEAQLTSTPLANSLVFNAEPSLPLGAYDTFNAERRLPLGYDSLQCGALAALACTARSMRSIGCPWAATVFKSEPPLPLGALHFQVGASAALGLQERTLRLRHSAIPGAGVPPVCLGRTVALAVMGALSRGRFAQYHRERRSCRGTGRWASVCVGCRTPPHSRPIRNRSIL